MSERYYWHGKTENYNDMFCGGSSIPVRPFTCVGIGKLPDDNEEGSGKESFRRCL